MMQRKASDFAEMLRNVGLRRTQMRLGVLRVLSSATQPLDAPAILSQFPDSADKVTVYRTLNRLTEKKLLHRIRGEDRSWLYAIGTGGGRAAHTHPHFVCDDCGTMECLEEVAVSSKVLRSIPVKKDYQIAYPEVTLHGKCAKCK